VVENECACRKSDGWNNHLGKPPKGAPRCALQYSRIWKNEMFLFFAQEIEKKKEYINIFSGK
jgi:hypothetical protein